MKKWIWLGLMSVALSACSAQSYSKKGNATVLSSKDIDDRTVELVVKKDDGNLVTLTRQYDAHAAVGARVQLDEIISQQDGDLTTIKRYEFK